MKTKTLLTGLATLCLATTSHANADLLVDFSDSNADVATGYAGFVFSNNTAPGSRTYNVGDAGYNGPSMDTGSGITVTLSSDAETNFRMADRGGDDFLRDWATIEGALNDNQDVTLAGLASGSYVFTASLDDLGNQSGVIDVLLSVDGGTTFTNELDDVAYGGTDDGYELGFSANGSDSVVIRYVAGGNVFGNTGGTTDDIRRNRLVSFNGFALAVPEPNSLALLGLGGLIAARRRRG